MNKKFLTIVFLFIVTITSFVACDLKNKENTAIFTSNTSGSTEVPSELDLSENVKDHENSDDYVWEDSDEIKIELNGNSADSESDSVIVKDSEVRINAAGTYRLSGELEDGQIIVDTDDDEIVRLILDGVKIHSDSSSAIYVDKADKVIIVLADNAENYISDADSYVYKNKDEDEPNAAIFSSSDVSLYTPSNGILNVEGNYNDAISSKDGIVIRNANISVKAEDDGIRGKDYVSVKSGDISIKSGGDGLKSDNSEKPGKGYVYLKSGKIEIESGTDAITAKKDIVIDDVIMKISSGGGSINTAKDDASLKGLKASVNITVNGGEIIIDSADDAIHANNNVVINNGKLKISSGDDGIHANSTLEINEGEIIVSKSYEGFESATITINGGTIHLTSSDDGINVAGGQDGSSMATARPGRGFFAENNGNYHLYINGGYLFLNANGDGLDSNGSIQITDGVIIVNGPVNNGNGALDAGSFFMGNGTLIAVGSSGMAESPDSTSSQYSVLINFDTSQKAGTLINIQTQAGKNILTFKPLKTYQSIVLSSPKLKEGETYVVSLGGTSTGTENDGVYEGGIYSGGKETETFEISEITTKIGETGMMRMGGMNGGMPGGQRPGNFGTGEIPTGDRPRMMPDFSTGEFPQPGTAFTPPTDGEISTPATN